MRTVSLRALCGLIWSVGWTAIALAGVAPGQGDAVEMEVLTRGPVHEAFAGAVVYDPQPGIIIEEAPPEPIEEVPPSHQPSGENVVWIAGYWAWDDEEAEFLWISGVWRNLPPGREWVPGYWGEVEDGYQWTSGYWADERSEEVTYLPAPPASLEVGASVAAPGDGYDWTPGSWIWAGNRYQWRPGFWTRVHPDWTWCPDSYSWTPRGYVFVSGYWDHLVIHRGLLFAPVRFRSNGYLRSGYRYCPDVVIKSSVFDEHLFVRPSYGHYYFGDYYEARYRAKGFLAPYVFRVDRCGYDPIFSRQLWKHRGDDQWLLGLSERYQTRRNDAHARPAHTWEASKIAVSSGRPESVLAEQLGEHYRANGGSNRFQTVSAEARQRMAERTRLNEKVREERRTAERVRPTGVEVAANPDRGPQTIQRSPGRERHLLGSGARSKTGTGPPSATADSARQAVDLSAVTRSEVADNAGSRSGVPSGVEPPPRGPMGQVVRPQVAQKIQPQPQTIAPQRVVPRLPQVSRRAEYSPRVQVPGRSEPQVQGAAVPGEQMQRPQVRSFPRPTAPVQRAQPSRVQTQRFQPSRVQPEQVQPQQVNPQDRVPVPQPRAGRTPKAYGRR